VEGQQPNVTIPASPNADAIDVGNAEEVLMSCLLVDDNQAFIEAARRVLDPGGVQVTGTASNIADALLRISELRPDVILVDVGLGDENGFDLARRLANGSTGSQAVIMISSEAADDYAELVAETSALGFLPKAELSADSIRQLLSKAAKPR
jgi:DNA-binding NarL/FixJ family response regulator